MGDKDESIYNSIAGLIFFLMVVFFVRCYYYKHIHNRAERVTPENSVRKHASVCGIPEEDRVDEIAELDRVDIIIKSDNKE